jgi:hypothetical protein
VARWIQVVSRRETRSFASLYFRAAGLKLVKLELADFASCVWTAATRNDIIDRLAEVRNRYDISYGNSSTAPESRAGRKRELARDPPGNPERVVLEQRSLLWRLAVPPKSL